MNNNRNSLCVNFESLERRDVMANHVTSNLTNGLLAVTGTDYSDIIEVRQVNTELVLAFSTFDNGKFLASGYSSYPIDSLSVVSVNGGKADDILRASKINNDYGILIYLSGEEGNNTIDSLQANIIASADKGNNNISGRGNEVHVDYKESDRPVNINLLEGRSSQGDCTITHVSFAVCEHWNKTS